MPFHFTIISNFISRHGARIALSVRDRTTERTAARQTKKEVLHYVQTGCGARPTSNPVSIDGFSPRGYSSLAVMCRGWEWVELYLHSLNTSLSYEFGSFWTSVHIHQTTRFHIQGAHKFNTQWRHKYKPQHPSFIIPWRRIFCPTFPVWTLRCQSWFALGSSQQRDS
jgi:hypothetical protein